LTEFFGFLLLSNLLRGSAVLIFYLGLVIHTLARVVSSVIAAALRAPRLSSLATVRLHEAAVLRWSTRFANAAALFWWSYLLLDLMGVKNEVSRAIFKALDARFVIKAFSISLGDFLAFLFVLVAGCLAASGIRFILREEILSRMRLSRGVPEMISTSSHYVLVLAVFLLSLTAAGVQLDKLTVLTGALGVGVGFGLQGFVNNFVSGLVLQFERPIRIGDVLEVANLSGEVRRIGVRSSTVRTFQGAEVIIPNSALVTSQVVNWTLSEPLRRVDLQVPVAYGAPPELVIELLSDVARGHKEVLRTPEPGAFFQAFGPCAMEFVLMFWAEQATHFRLRSEIGIAVSAALRRAGIEIPLPQQEIRVRSVDSSTLRELRRAGAI
jgi:small-conductance mechanosensitive channel